MRSLVVLAMVVSVAVIGCKKTDVASYPPLTDYFAMKVGSSYTYRLDSTVTVSFGSSLGTRYYVVKDTVVAQFTDALGQKSYRIYRYQTDTLQSQPWTYLATFVATINAAKQQIEYVDNRNLRYILLHEPISEGFNWNGNSYIETGSGPFQYMSDWDYTYENIGQSYTVRKGKFDTTISILQVDAVDPPGPFDPNSYQQTNYSKEVYAKGVGLIYKEFLHKTWQATPPPAHWTDDTYGVKMNLVSYK